MKRFSEAQKNFPNFPDAKDAPENSRYQRLGINDNPYVHRDPITSFFLLRANAARLVTQSALQFPRNLFAPRPARSKCSINTGSSRVFPTEPVCFSRRNAPLHHNSRTASPTFLAGLSGRRAERILLLHLFQYHFAIARGYPSESLSQRFHFFAIPCLAPSRGVGRGGGEGERVLQPARRYNSLAFRFDDINARPRGRVSQRG